MVPIDHYDRVFYMAHRLGLQSNILVSARYSPVRKESKDSSEHRLSWEAVVAALRSVVETHQVLRSVAVVRKSPKNNKHYLKLAMLHTIDLNQCIEFLEDDIVGPELFQKIHNTWEWLEEEPIRPWWKVYVVRGRDVVWVSHHAVCDANSGIPFHRTFLHGINSYMSERPIALDPIVSINPSSATHSCDALALSKHKASIIEILWTSITRSLIRLLLGSGLMFTSLPQPKPYFRSVSEVAPLNMRTVTTVSALRIPAQKMNRILAACRANNTTFTGLLMVMLLTTFAVDLFPDDWVGCSLFAFDIRPYLKIPELHPEVAQDGIMLNGGSGGFLTHWLKNYRKLMTKSENEGHPVTCLDSEAVWKLARTYRREMTEGMPSRFMRAWAAAKWLPKDLEKLVDWIFDGIGNATSMTFLCSNLGAFSFQASEKEASVKQSWIIEDLQFSAASVNGNVGSRGFVFNVVGVKGRDTVIHLSCEEGVVSREMAEKSLKLTMDKIDLLLEATDEAVSKPKPRTRGFWIR
ncbi:alcohol acetyltransferase [Mariannaea sp. PMI_226]|nr:alcohol acetyltransferase [Mariannaea sp. PMI_226]